MAIEFKSQAAQGVSGAATGGGGATGTVNLQGSASGLTGLTLTLHPSGSGPLSFSFGLSSLQSAAQQDPNGPLAQLLNHATAPGAPTTFQVTGHTLTGLLQDLTTALPGATTGGQPGGGASPPGLYTHRKLPGRLKSGQIVITRSAAESGPGSAPQSAVNFFVKLAQEAGAGPTGATGGQTGTGVTKTDGIKLETGTIELKTNAAVAPRTGTGGPTDTFLKIEGIKLETPGGGTGAGSGLESAAALASLQLNTPPQSPAGAVIDALINRLSQGPPGQTGTPPGPPPPPPIPGVP